MVIILGALLRVTKPGLDARSGFARLLRDVVMLVGVGMAFLNAIILIEAGEVGVKHFLGSVSPVPLEQGVHVIIPLASVEQTFICEQGFPADGTVERIEVQPFHIF